MLQVLVPSKVNGLSGFTGACSTMVRSFPLICHILMLNYVDASVYEMVLLLYECNMFIDLI